MVGGLVAVPGARGAVRGARGRGAPRRAPLAGGGPATLLAGLNRARPRRTEQRPPRARRPLL